MRARTALLTAAALGAAAAPALAQSWAEVASGGINGPTDAGQSVVTANITSGFGPLTTITGSHVADGTTGNWDADMFCIHITDPQAFSASTAAGDTNLALFTSTGVAIAFNDNRTDSATALTSLLTNLFTANLAPGDYLLGVSRNGGNANGRRYTRPLDVAGGLLFSGPANGTPDTDPNTPFRRQELGPIIPGAVLGGWETQPPGGFLPFNANYTITLTGASYCIPAPGASAALVLAGAAALRRRRR